MLHTSENTSMEKGTKIQLLCGFTGGWLIIFAWARSYLASDTTNLATGRITFVAAIYLVIFLYGLCKMFIPEGLKIPEYSESKYHPGGGFAEYWDKKRKKKED